MASGGSKNIDPLQFDNIPEKTLQGAEIKPRKITVTHEFTLEEWDLLRLLAMRLKLTPAQAVRRFVRGGIEGLKVKN